MKYLFTLLVFVGVLFNVGYAQLLDNYDISSSPNGIIAMPDVSDAEYASFVKYTKIEAPNGKAIHFVIQDQITDAQIIRARNILKFYLTNFPGSEYGADKTGVANAMGTNGAALMLLNGSDGDMEHPRINAQTLYQNEMAVEGHAWYINNEYDEHRDAAYEEILHMMHDYGFGVDNDGTPNPDGALPTYQAEIRAAQVNGLSNNLWGIGAEGWIAELTQENSLSQEYLASVVDNYYGLWGAWTGSETHGMWGLYVGKTRAEIEEEDPMGYALMPKYFSPYININMDIDPTFEGSFTMTFDEAEPYTHKSQYLQHCTLTGTNASNLKGNDLYNRLNGNEADNVLNGSKGNDRLDGQGGTDVVIFTGNQADYTPLVEGGFIIVTDNVDDRDGTDTLFNIEIARFADGDFNIPQPENEAPKTGSFNCVDPNAPTTGPTEQQKVFQEFWDVYDKHYPLMHRKNIDWQAVYDTYYPQITATTTDAQLFNIFNTIFSTILQDGHSGLSFNGRQETNFEQDFNQEIQNMVQNNTPGKVNIVASSANNPYISYGTLVSDENIGYIHSKQFEPVVDTVSEFDNFKAIVDEALAALQDKSGIIIDIRTNGGGQAPYAYYLAGRFFANTTPIELVRMRYKTTTGSTESSLSDWVTENFDGYPDARAEEGTIASIFTGDFTVTPSGPFQYTNKVALFTSRGSASAAEYFTAAMKNQDQVKTFGNTTSGIYAGSESLTLNEGGGKWTTRLSVQDVELLYEGTYQSFESSGIVPDELILPTATDVSEGKEVHIEAALNYLN